MTRTLFRTRLIFFGDFEKVKSVLRTLWAMENNIFDISTIGFDRDLIRKARF